MHKFATMWLLVARKLAHKVLHPRIVIITFKHVIIFPYNCSSMRTSLWDMSPGKTVKHVYRISQRDSGKAPNFKCSGTIVCLHLGLYLQAQEEPK